MRKSKRIIKGSFLKEFVEETFLQSYPIISDTKMTLVKNKLLIEYFMDEYIKRLYNRHMSYKPYIEDLQMNSDIEYSTYYNSNKKKTEVCYSGYREKYMQFNVTNYDSLEGALE